MITEFAPTGTLRQYLSQTTSNVYSNMATATDLQRFATECANGAVAFNRLDVTMTLYRRAGIGI